jgi:D-beta-D-heptose 7-phosphate kinase/D-beta-D-heptose 1-phosphate adenosyltransferase
MVLSKAEAIAFAETIHAGGGKLVFTNGVFDLLHPGHVRYLQAARQIGDALIVAINSDRSARALEKGPDRPITPAEERAEIVAALSCVDATVIFDEDTPHEIVTALQPDVLVKGRIGPKAPSWGQTSLRRVAEPSSESRSPRVTRRRASFRRFRPSSQSHDTSASSGEPVLTKIASPMRSR